MENLDPFNLIYRIVRSRELAEKILVTIPKLVDLLDELIDEIQKTREEILETRKEIQNLRSDLRSLFAGGEKVEG